MRGDKLAACCRLRPPLPQTVPVPTTTARVHTHTHTHITSPLRLLPGLAALQQSSTGLLEFTYKPGQGENSAPALGAGQQQYCSLQRQQLYALTQRVQAVSVHQHSLLEGEVNPEQCLCHIITIFYDLNTS